MKEKIESQIEESYNHIKSYLNGPNSCSEELTDMCRHCEDYCGPQHDWEDCLDMPCFRFYLAYQYLKWLNSSDGY